MRKSSIAAPVDCSSAMPPTLERALPSGAMALVLVDHPRPHVAVITLHRPERLNALSIELVSELFDALMAVGEENDTWVVVLTGSGRAFTSGLDLKDYGIVPNIDGLQVGRIAQRAMRHYSRLVPLL